MIHGNKRYQRGDAMMIVVAILVCTLLGALGFVAWQNFAEKDDVSKSEDSQQETSKTDQKQDETQREPYKGERVSPVNEAYSIKVPNGWAVNRFTDYPSLLTTPMLGEKSTPTYNVSQHPEVETVPAGMSQSTSNFSIDDRTDDGGTIYYDYQGQKSTFTLTDGTEGGKWSWAEDGTFGKAHNAMYVFTKGGKTIVAHWRQPDTTPSDEQKIFIDNVIRSLEIK